MKLQFLHKFSNSFLMWFEHFLDTQGEDFETKEVTFKYIGESEFLDGYEVWQSGCEQLVCDSSVKKAVTPTTTTVDGREFLVQFEGGNLLSPKDETVEPVEEITLECSPKEFTVLFSEMSNGQIIENAVEEAMEKKAKNPNIHLRPMVVLCVDNMKNDAFSLGGMVTTTIYAKAVVFTEEQYLLDGIISVFLDSKEEAFAMLTPEEYPLNELGVMKEAYRESGYDYFNLSETNIRKRKTTFYIDKVYCYKANDKISRSETAGLRFGFIDFEIGCDRYRKSDDD